MINLRHKFEDFWDKIAYIPEKVIHKVYYFFLYRFHPKHKYQLLNTELPPAYYDLDTRILYAVMNNFVDFYKESSFGYLTRNCDWNTHPEIINADEFTKQWFDDHRKTKEELDIIYDWWIDRYLQITKEHQEYWNNSTINGSYRKNHREMFELEDQLEKEADEMLQRLMKYRRSLWD